MRRNRLRSRVRLRKNDFEGVTDRSDKTLEVLLSSAPRKSVVIFSARARTRTSTRTTQARPRSRRGLVPTPDAVIFAELPRVLGGEISFSLSPRWRAPLLVLSPKRSEFPSLFLFLGLSVLPSTIMCIT